MCYRACDMPQEITIVGGGIAGLTLGILLRREKVAVRLFEAGHYPRHRVCGEFLSGRGLSLLNRSRLLNDLEGLPGRTVRFFRGEGSSGDIDLPEPAFCVSRHALDQKLADHFIREGGQLFSGERWQGDFSDEGLVRATGRRPGPARETSWTGLKMHVSGMKLRTDLEMHFSADGYVGLSQLPKNLVNVCGLFRKRNGSVRGEHDPLRGIWNKPREVFGSVLDSDGTARLNHAEVVEGSLCAVAGISLLAERCGTTSECRIGDTVSVIPPFTGNGMSLAVESAFLAAPILTDYAREEIDWCVARGKISQNWEKSFRPRLRISSMLQKLTSAGPVQNVLLSGIKTMPAIIRICFGVTR